MVNLSIVLLIKTTLFLWLFSNVRIFIFILENNKKHCHFLTFLVKWNCKERGMFMKKNLKILLEIIILLLICVLVFVFNSKKQGKDEKQKYGEKNVFNSNNEIKTALTLNDKIQNDTIWCGTFQLLWNDLKNNWAKHNIEFNPQKQVVKNLNEETFTINDISDKYYYKKIGVPTIQLKQEIENAIKEKFNETSNI